MSADGVAIHRQPFLKPGWRFNKRFAPTPDSFSFLGYITMICVESSRFASRIGLFHG